MLDTALDGVIVMGSDGCVLDWNGQAEIIFEWKRVEVLGQEIGKLIIPHQYRQAHATGLRHYLKTREGPVLRKRIEISALRKSGEEFPIELSIAPIEWEGDTLFLGFLRDISDRRAAEKVLEFQAREAILLHRVTTLAAETSSRDDIIKLCLESVCELIGWPLGHAYVVGPEGTLVSTAWTGDTSKFTSLQRSTEDFDFRTGVGLPGRVLQTREAVWIADIAESDIFVRGGVAEDFGIRAAFAFPIMVGDAVLAVLEFFGLASLAPDCNILLTARTMGDQVGRVLERRRVQDHQELLLAELNHRAKNMLAVVMGMASQTARSAKSVEDFTANFFARINSLSRAYSLLTATNWEATSFTRLVSEVISPHLASPAQLSIAGPPLMLPPKAALAMSMILHELTTNAAKYGALSRPEGGLMLSSTIEQRLDGKILRLSWRETGVSGITSPAKAGFGTKLIETSIRHDLGGRVETTFTSEGVRYDFEFPQPS